MIGHDVDEHHFIRAIECRDLIHLRLHLSREVAVVPLCHPEDIRDGAASDPAQRNRELAAALLGKHGLTVETAENGADGLERLLDQDFDVIFMDNQMPVMGGLEAARRIRALPTAKGRVPIIGLTGRATEDDHQDGLDAGMNDYLVKPFSPADLETVLNRWLPLDELNPAD